MIPSVIIWFLCTIFNMLFLLPLSLLGGAIAGDWTAALQGGIQFMFRPLLYFQGFIDVQMAFRMIGWCFDVVMAWLYFVAAKFIYGLIRGYNPELISESRFNVPSS